VPRTKSAKKQMRQAVARTARNRQQRSALRTAIKKLRSVIGTKEGKVAYLEAEKQLDRAGRKGIIHRNTAARQKSRLAKRVKK